MCQNAVKSRFRRVLRYVHLVVSNPCDVCLSVVCNVGAAYSEGGTFKQYFCTV